ncbi:hypothetical protein EV426DRAFT_704133 [Tirmania nivea]|nr:hypothetical protein EV426DRAFT_704133 [Tirmania nivea]
MSHSIPDVIILEYITKATIPSILYTFRSILTSSYIVHSAILISDITSANEVRVRIYAETSNRQGPVIVLVYFDIVVINLDVEVRVEGIEAAGDEVRVEEIKATKDEVRVEGIEAARN